MFLLRHLPTFAALLFLSSATESAPILREDTDAPTEVSSKNLESLVVPFNTLPNDCVQVKRFIGPLILGGSTAVPLIADGIAKAKAKAKKPKRDLFIEIQKRDPLSINGNVSVQRHAPPGVMYKRDMDKPKAKGKSKHESRIKRFFRWLTSPFRRQRNKEKANKHKRELNTDSELLKREPFQLTGQISAHRHAPVQGSEMQKREPAAGSKTKVLKKTGEIVGPALMTGVPMVLDHYQRKGY